MTWLKTGAEFSKELAGISDAAYRTHHEGLGYALDRENDGLLSERDVRRFAETADPASAVQELLDHGLWVREGDGYRIVHHMDEQPTAANIRLKRANDAARQRRKREMDALKASGLTEKEAAARYEEVQAVSRRDSQAVSRRDSQVDITRDPVRNGTVRNGTDRLWTGKEEQARNLEPEAEAKLAASVPARLKSVPMVETLHSCSECENPLQPDGSCWVCGPAKKVLTW